MTNPFQAGGTMPESSYARPVNMNAEPSKGNQELLLSSVISEYDLNEQMQLSSVATMADNQTRSMAAALAIEWAKSGETDYESLEALVVGAINDGDDDITDEEQEDIDELLQAVGQFIADHTGLSSDEVELMFEQEDDDLAIDAADEVERNLKRKNQSELIADYAAKQGMLLSAVKKVVRDGKVVRINKRPKKYRMTSARRAALKKIRKKSNTAAARAQREKSNRVRKNAGLNKK